MTQQLTPNMFKVVRYLEKARQTYVSDVAELEDGDAVKAELTEDFNAYRAEGWKSLMAQGITREMVEAHEAEMTAAGHAPFITTAEFDAHTEPEYIYGREVDGETIYTLQQVEGSRPVLLSAVAAEVEALMTA